MSDQRLRSRSFFGGFKVTKCGYSFVHICLGGHTESCTPVVFPPPSILFARSHVAQY